jgi:hypothetical protein
MRAIHLRQKQGYIRIYFSHIYIFIFVRDLINHTERIIETSHICDDNTSYIEYCRNDVGI